MRNLHRRFDWHYIRQIHGGDFAKFCGLLRIKTFRRSLLQKHNILSDLLSVSDDLSPECKRLVGRKRIRKEVNRLTPKEKFHLNFAMKLAMASPPYYPKNSLVYKDIANYHGAPYTICTHPDWPEGEFVKKTM